jgi:type IV secretory pathway TrbF-like protein
MNFFKRSKQDVALAKAPGHYSEDDPEKIIFDVKTRLFVEANHWKLFAAIMALVALVAVSTRNPPPSVVKSYGVSADTAGTPVLRELTTYQPNAQAIRVAMKEMTERWFTIEPILSGDIRHSRMATNIKAVQLQMEGKAQSSFLEWLKNDAPFEAIAADPKLTRQVTVTNVALLEDSTVVVNFTTSTAQGESDQPVVQRFSLTLRYEVQAPASDVALTSNPFGIFVPFYTLEKSA